MRLDVRVGGLGHGDVGCFGGGRDGRFGLGSGFGGRFPHGFRGRFARRLGGRFAGRGGFAGRRRRSRFPGSLLGFGGRFLDDLPFAKGLVGHLFGPLGVIDGSFFGGCFFDGGF